MIGIDLQDKRPLYLQIIEGIESLTLKGILKPNEQLPSVRSLAMDLSISPNTIQRAYLELEKRGIIYSLSGKGSFISENSAALEKEKMAELYRSLNEIVVTAKTLKISEKKLREKVSEFYHCGKVGDFFD